MLTRRDASPHAVGWELVWKIDVKRATDQQRSSVRFANFDAEPMSTCTDRLRRSHDGAAVTCGSGGRNWKFFSIEKQVNDITRACNSCYLHSNGRFGDGVECTTH